VLGLAGIGVLVLLSSSRAVNGSLHPAVHRTSEVRLAGETIPGLESALRSGAIHPLASSSAELAGPMTLTVTLRRTDQVGFNRFVAAVEDPHSPLYRHFASQLDLSARYGPTRQAYDRVLGYLRTHGLTPVGGSANRLTLTVRGSRGAAERAFGVQIRDFESGGGRFYANASDPLLPSSIADNVLDVSGLSSLARARPAAAQAAGMGVVAVAWSAPYMELEGALYALYYAQAAANAGAPGADAELFLVVKRVEAACRAMRIAITTTEIRAIAESWFAAGDASQPARLRGLAADATGAGQKVGVLSFSGFRTSDVADELAAANLPASQINQISRVDVGGGAPITPDESEALLGIQAVTSVAPGAQVVVYDAPETDPAIGFQTLFNRMINDGVTVISNSFGYCEDQATPAEVTSIDSILAAGAASGVSVFNATGDSGSACSDGSPGTIAVPADSPNATAVGGSSVTPGAEFTYGTETWWDGSSSGGGQGGYGVSGYFAKPAYQRTLIAGSARSVPDVVSEASPGVALCVADAGGCSMDVFHGGTSMATPLWAAMGALLNQAEGHRLGLLNPLLYPLAHTAAFHSASTMGSDPAHVGLGSPNFDTLSLTLGKRTAGPVDPAQSSVTESAPNPLTPFIGVVPADGSTEAAIVVRLVDADGHSVSGKSLSLTASGGSHAIVSPGSGVSNTANGAVVFLVKDSTVEKVTFTAEDLSDGVALSPQRSVDFVSPPTPPATAGSIGANPTSVAADGAATSTITVTLHNAQSQGAQGKVVTLAASGGNSAINGPSPVSTDSSGKVTFTVSDATAESVSYTATDVTDGDLPVPGTATVDFTTSASNNETCANSTSAAPSTSAGFAFTNFATGFPNSVHDSCIGPIGIAFDAHGNLFALDADNATLYTFGQSGGTANAATEIGPVDNSNPSRANDAWDGVVFGKDGELFAADQGNNRVVQLNPGTGDVARTLADNSSNSLFACPLGITVDPLSDDLIVATASHISCAGGIWRIHNPSSGSPTLSSYVSCADLPSCGADGIAISPDGTIFVAGANDTVYSISGTNVSGKPTVSAVASVCCNIDGIAVGVDPAAPTHASYLLVDTNHGEIVKVSDLSSMTPTQTTVFSGGSRGDFVAVGPDGCDYATQTDRVIRLSNADGSCPGLAPTSAEPSIRLTPSVASPSPTQGTQQTITATFENVNAPTGTPVQVVVMGPNYQILFARTSANDQATFTYTGTFTGLDVLRATATVDGQSVFSNPAQIRWTAGKHRTFLSLNPSPTTGALGHPVALKASLTDVSVTPFTAISAAGVTFDLHGATCGATTNGGGIGSCAVTPRAGGASPLTAMFAGTSQFLASSASTGFFSHAAAADLGPPNPSCARPQGKLAGKGLGFIKLGMTIRRAEQIVPKFRKIGFGFIDFCLFPRVGLGIRVNDPSPRLLARVPKRSRAPFKGRIVIALTNNPFYTLRGIQPGTKLNRARHKLQLGPAFHIGKNVWYIIPGKNANGLFKVRKGVILEVGIANKQLSSGSYAARFKFLNSWSRIP
jgi:hypothetical protein